MQLLYSQRSKHHEFKGHFKTPSPSAIITLMMKHSSHHPAKSKERPDLLVNSILEERDLDWLRNVYRKHGSIVVREHKYFGLWLRTKPSEYIEDILKWIGVKYTIRKHGVHQNQGIHIAGRANILKFCDAVQLPEEPRIRTLREYHRLMKTGWRHSRERLIWERAYL